MENGNIQGIVKNLLALEEEELADFVREWKPSEDECFDAIEYMSENNRHFCGRDRPIIELLNYLKDEYRFRIQITQELRCCYGGICEDRNCDPSRYYNCTADAHISGSWMDMIVNDTYWLNELKPFIDTLRLERSK